MRFSYAVVALIGAAHAMPKVGSLVTGRGVCNSAGDCKGVTRAVVTDQAALDARKKVRQAKTNATTSGAGASGDDDDDDDDDAAAESSSNSDKKRSKPLFQVKPRANETAPAAPAAPAGEDAEDAEEDAEDAAGEEDD